MYYKEWFRYRYYWSKQSNTICRLKKAKSKGFAGGRVPLGYTLIDSEVLEVDPDEAETIRTIYKLRKEGVSLQKIADHLAAKGIRNKSSKPFSKQAISYITKNPIYSGIYKYDGDKENNDISFKVPCIVSKELWSEVNK